MAISKTGAIYKTLTFDGENSKDYGIYITGEAVFNAPEREVEMVTIPGRNGQFALDMGRFENIEVTYPAGLFASTESDFADAISDFRNLLCSKRGYVRLQDDYNPNEYRMAVYKSGLELDPLQLKAGEFEITFDCKPQRYLTSGEEEITVGGWEDITTDSGQTIEIDNPDGNIGIQALSVSLVPVQSGTGTPSPDNVRPISGYDTVDVIVSPTLSAADGRTYTTSLSETVYGGTLDVVTGELIIEKASVDLGTLTWVYSGGDTYPYFRSDSISSLAARVPAHSVVANMVCEKYQMTDLDHAFSGAVTDCLCETTWGQIRIYDTAYNDATIFKNSLNNVKLVYELATPRTIQLTPQSIELLLGANNVWSDGDITVTYGRNLSMLYNPTLFDAEPLLKVKGYGTIGFNGYEIELANATMGEVEIVSNKTMTQTSYDPGTQTTVLESQAIPITDYANVGDDFTASVNITDSISSLGVKSITSATISSQPTNGFASVQISGKKLSLKISDIELGGASNADTQITTSCSASITFINSLNTSQTVTLGLSVTLAFDATAQNLTVTSDFTPAGGFVSFGDVESIVKSFVVDSTVSILGNPTYIDCELGECYRIENDTVISLNRYIDLGSDLPKLAPGTNTFTKDNTVTELKVIPRWWKV